MQAIPIQNINLGGIADSDYQGVPNSIANMVGLDIHSTPGLIKVNQKLIKDSGQLVDAFVKVSITSSDGSTYYFSSTTGKIWQRNSAGTWSLVYTTVPTTGGAGCLGAKEYNGYIYWATQNYLHRIPITGTTDASAWSTNAVPNWKALHLDQEIALRPAGVLLFDGVDDYVDIASNTLAIGNTFTISVWFKTNKDSSGLNKYTIWGANNVSGNPQVELGGENAGNNRNRIAILSGSTIIAETVNDAFEKDVWNHLVYVRTGTGAGTHKIYINGVEKVLRTDSATNFSDTASAKLIGARTSSTYFFSGEIVNFIMWSSAFNASAVSNLYTYNKYTSSGIVAKYYLNRDVQDSGSTNHGTITNGAEFILEPTATSDETVPYLNLPPVFRYNPPSSVSEAAGNKLYFSPAETRLHSLEVYIADKGTGDLTLKIHNSSDTELASLQILNASLSNGWNTFNFTDFNLTLGSELHLHFVSNQTDLFLKSANPDMFDTPIKIYSESDSEFHHMVIQNLVLYIGDRNYIHQVEQDPRDGEHIFSYKALDIKRPYRIKCLGIFDTDVLIGTFIADNVNETEILIWNTWSQSYTASDTIKETGINAFIDADNYVIVNAGLNANLYVWDGRRLELYKSIRGDYSPTQTAVVHPYAVANYQGLPLFGLSNDGGNPTNFGVYSFGAKRAGYPKVLNLEFPISQRSSNEFVLTNIEIGAMLVAGNDLFVSWKRNATITVTIANPAVVTYTAHGFSDGDPIVFSTTGALPTGITAGTVYYVRSTGTNTLNLYDTSAHAIAGGTTGRVTTSGSQSGTHTATIYGVDKLDFTAKLEKAYFETRIINLSRNVLETYKRTYAAYKSLPANTGIVIKHKVNNADDWTAYTTKDSTIRKIVYGELTLQASSFQIRVEFTVSTNNAPSMEALIIELD